MTNQLHDGESDRRQQVKFRADAQLVEDFDATIEGSRAEAFREFMRQRVGQGDAPDFDDRQLAAALGTLRRFQHPDNHTVPGRMALSKIAEYTDVSDKREIKRRILRPLDDRGFIDTPVQGVIRLTEKGRGGS